MRVFCKYCGGAVAEGAYFCPLCGKNKRKGHKRHYGECSGYAAAGVAIRPAGRQWKGCRQPDLRAIRIFLPTFGSGRDSRTSIAFRNSQELGALTGRGLAITGWCLVMRDSHLCR